MDGSADLNKTLVTLTGQNPRELLVFDSVVSENFDPGGLPYWWRIPQPARFTNIGGVGLAKGNHTRSVPFMVLKARLIDHGECRTSFPFFGEKGLFTTLNKQFGESVRGPIECPKTIHGASGGFQATFLKNPQSFSDQNDDGFGFDLTYEVDVKQLPLTSAFVSIGVNYAVRHVSGLPAVEPVGPVLVSVDMTGLDDIRIKTQASIRATLTGSVGHCLPAHLKDEPPCSEKTGSVDLSKEPTCRVGAECDSGICAGVPLPTQFREQAIQGASVEIKEKDAAEGIPCVLNAEGDRFCDAIGRLGIRKAYTDAGGTLGAWVEANLRHESFVCRPSALYPGSGNGTCWYHPVFKRTNVLPEGLELVWYDTNETLGKDPATVDYEVVRTLKPSEVAGACGPIDARDKPVAMVPTLAASLP